MAKTRKFRVAVEGPTVDGRVIEASWLRDIAATYNRTTYAARVNMEHIRGITADKPFKAFGDVLAVSTEEVELEIGGKKEKKLALYAEIDATDDLVAMNRDRQKLYSSIEVNPNFANTGKAYLVGLAATDSPASLGTEALTFAVKNPGAIRNAPQLQADGNVFSLGLETSFELAEGGKGEAPSMSEEAKGFFSAAADFFKGLTAKEPVTPPADEPVTPPPANDNEARFAAMVSGIAKMNEGIEQIGKDFAAQIGTLRTDLNAVKTSIETTDNSQQQRTPATGGANFATDC